MATIILHPTAKPSKVSDIRCAGCNALIPIYELNGVLIELDNSKDLHRFDCSELDY